MNFKKEKEELENMLKKALQEPNTEHVYKFRCAICDFHAETRVSLTHHIKRKHCKDQTCQTSDRENPEERSEELISEYPCFYCGCMIRTNESLQKHIPKCHETGVVIANIENLEESTELFQCSDCGAKCDDKTNLDGHISTYHELGTFYCDVCPLKFPTNGHLYFHKQRCHDEDEF